LIWKAEGAVQPDFLRVRLIDRIVALFAQGRRQRY
jgi:hypothetical protein